MTDWNERVAGNWNQFAGKVKEQWGKLTDDDLTRMPILTELHYPQTAPVHKASNPTRSTLQHRKRGA